MHIQCSNVVATLNRKEQLQETVLFVVVFVPDAGRVEQKCKDINDGIWGKLASTQFGNGSDKLGCERKYGENVINLLLCCGCNLRQKRKRI